jgi:hypothetical protein
MWSRNESALLMASDSSSQEVQTFLHNMNVRARASISAGSQQTRQASAQIADINRRITARLHLWRQIARLNQAQVQRNRSQPLVFREYVIDKGPTFPVVLGDSPHQYAGFDVVYRNTPQSLREIEETAGFET